MHPQTIFSLVALMAAALASPFPAPLGDSEIEVLEAREPLADPTPVLAADDDFESLEERAIPAKCTNGVVVFGVRGSSDNPTTTSDPKYWNVLPTEFSTIANAAISKAGGGYLQAIDYPASSPAVNNGANYGPSVAAGIKSLQQSIYNYIGACSTGSIVVLGYSQGAQVVADGLAGSNFGPRIKADGRIKAGAIFADPAYQDGYNPVDQGTGANNGHNGTYPVDPKTYPVLNTGGKGFANRVRSYCEAGDKYCDSNFGVSSDMGAIIHGRSVAVHAQAAQDFIVSKL